MPHRKLERNKARHRHREEVLNTCLAVLLARHGVDAEAETIDRFTEARPDVMFTMGGLRVIVEGKFEDVPDADAAVLNDAARRIETGICHIAVALIYPKALRSTPTDSMEAALSKARLRYSIVSEAGKTQWVEAAPSSILASLRRVHESLISDDIVAEAAHRLWERIESIAALWSGQSATCDRLSSLLGMPRKRGETTEESEARRATATRIASLVLANAMIFQEQLVANGGDGRIVSLRAYDNVPDPVVRIKSHWNLILRGDQLRADFQDRRRHPDRNTSQPISHRSHPLAHGRGQGDLRQTVCSAP